MKKLATLVFALLLGASLSFAQAGGSSDTKTDTKTETGKKGKKAKKAKKSKKSTNDSSTPAPK